MNNEAVFEADFTLEDSHVREGIRMWYKKGHKVFSVCTLALGIMCIFPGLVYIGVMVIPAVSTFFFVAAAMFLLFHFKGYMFAADTEIKALHKLFETDENCGKFHITFFDNMFEQSTKVATKKFMYSDINIVAQNDELIIMGLEGKKLFFVVKSGINEEKSQELYDMLVDIANNNRKGEEVAKKEPVKMSDIVAKSGEAKQ